jgi:cobalamin-dependent methionine synthase I
MSFSKEKEIYSLIEQASQFIHLRACAYRQKIEQIFPKKIIFSSRLILEGTNIAKLLENCNEALFMGVTAGREIMVKMKQLTKENNLTTAVIFDAAASEMVDSGLEWLIKYFNQSFLPENKRLLNTRFSCGYGDLALANQKIFYDLLQLDRLDVKINENFILDPEKTVTAVTGIV